MLFRIGAAIIILLSIVILAIALSANAAKAIDINHKGLTIAPATQDVIAKAGQVTTKKVEVANYGKKPLTVALQVKEFETTDYSYDFVFKDPTNQWLVLEQNRLTIQPQQKILVTVAVDVPENAPPRSHYFALFASADMSEESGFKQTAQVVSLFMVKVEGEWQETGTIHDSHVPFLNIDSKITYRFDAENTGNVHYNIVVFGQVESLFGGAGKQQGAGHVLIPNAKRTIEGSVTAPLLPGFYKFTYGYTLGSGSTVTSKTVTILYMPPWAMIAIVIIIFIFTKLWRRYRHQALQAI